jgi:TPR repeat protein
MYKYGRGVQQSDQEAVKYYQLAAVQGLTAANMRVRLYIKSILL